MPTTRTPDLDAASIAALDALLTAAYGRPAGWRTEIERVAALDAEAWVVVEEEGRLVACGSGLAFGAYGWVGLVATQPGEERRGLGALATAVVSERLRARGCATLALDASDKGRGLYLRLGYVEVGRVRQLDVPRSITGPGRAVVALAAGASLDAVVELDRQVSGGERRGLIERLRIEGLPCLIAPDTGGALAGYAFVQASGTIGPAAATDTETAQALLAAAVLATSDATELRVLVPPEYRHLALLHELGCTEARTLAHMRLGPLMLPGDRTCLLGETSYAVG